MYSASLSAAGFRNNVRRQFRVEPLAVPLSAGASGVRFRASMFGQPPSKRLCKAPVESGRTAVIASGQQGEMESDDAKKKIYFKDVHGLVYVAVAGKPSGRAVYIHGLGQGG